MGFRDVRITIYNCDDMCRTCNGPSNIECTSCYETFILEAGSCICDKNNYYDSTDLTFSSQGACKKCGDYYGNNKGLSPTCYECHFKWLNKLLNSFRLIS